MRLKKLVSSPWILLNRAALRAGRPVGFARVTCLVGLMLGVGLGDSRGAEEEMDPWVAASSFLVQDAYGAFEAGKEIDPVERKFGLAVTLMNLQPRTEGNLLEAVKLFNEVAAEVPVGEPVNALARFFRARLQEFYLADAEPEAARAEYLALVQERTGNPVVELAASRLVLLDAFGAGSEAERLAQLAELEGLGEFLETPAGKREFHAALALALVENGGDKSRAVDHFLAADEIGYTRKSTAVSVWFSAAAIAEAAGRTSDARHFYNRIIEAYPQDPRVFTVRQLLNELPPDNG